jgi:hypothetical protein
VALLVPLALLFVIVSDPDHQPLRAVIGIAVLLAILPTFGGGGRERDESEWSMPAWLDFLGSVVFGRFIRRGLRFGFQRDRA